LISGKQWSGPREGINWAGYVSWLVGFIVGLLPFDFMHVPADLKPYVQPAVVYSFIVGFVLYTLLAKAGLLPKVSPIPSLSKV
jgi:cytosine permease